MTSTGLSLGRPDDLRRTSGAMCPLVPAPTDRPDAA